MEPDYYHYDSSKYLIFETVDGWIEVFKKTFFGNYSYITCYDSKYYELEYIAGDYYYFIKRLKK